MASTYSLRHRLFEISAVALYLALLIWWFIRANWVEHLTGPGTYGLAALAIFSGLMVADFVSGLVHWLADTFGRKDWPFLGEAFIRPFREHHDDPNEIARHDFIEVNGNSCVCILLFMPVVWGAQAVAPPIVDGFIDLWTIAFTITVFFTNQIHAWAHAESVPAVVAFMQRHRIILNVADHELHHTPPHKSYFCISYGWCNPIVEKLQVFQALHPLVALFLPLAEDDDDAPVSTTA